jgi:prevent-host-death family protein
MAVSIIVNVGEAKTRLSELLAKVEAGEDVVIARSGHPAPKLSRVRRDTDLAALIAEIHAARAGLPATRADEILAWRNEDRR